MRLPFVHSRCRSVGARAALGLLAFLSTGDLNRIAAAPTDRREAGQAEALSTRTGSVTIDVRAVFGDGRPVTDLTTRDLTVTIAGTARPIQSMRRVDDTGAGQAASGSAGPPTEVPPPFATNAREGDGRALYLLVDDDSTDETGTRALASAAATFLDGLSPGDEVALATVGAAHATVGPTVSRSAVRAAVGAISGRVGARVTTALAVARSRSCLLRLETLLDDLHGSPTPPIVVLLSGGLSAAAVTGSADGGRPLTSPVSGRASGDPTADLLGPIRRAAALAHAVLYVVALRPPTDGTASGLNLLATHLGVPIFNATAPENGLVRIARETTAHYAVLLADGAVPTSTDPSALAVTTTRPGLAVRATVWFPSTGVAMPSVEALLGSPDQIPGLPIRTQALVTRGTSREAGKLAVTSFIEPVDPASGLVSVGSELIDEAGGVVARDLPGPRPAGTLAVSRLVAPPGHYRLRVAALGADRRAGTVERSIEVGLIPAGPLKLGSLALGLPLPPPTPARGRAGGRVEPAAGPQPRCEFGADAEALAFFDLYGGVANEQVMIVMEVLRRPDGPPIELLQPQIQAATVGESDHYQVFATLELGDLRPGDYLVRATVTLGGQPPGILTQTLRKRATGTVQSR